MRQRICVVGHLRAAEDAMLRYRLHEKQLEFSHRLLLVCSVHVHACVRASQAVISGAFCLSLSLSTSLTQTNIYISSVFFFHSICHVCSLCASSVWFSFPQPSSTLNTVIVRHAFVFWTDVWLSVACCLLLLLMTPVHCHSHICMKHGPAAAVERIRIPSRGIQIFFNDARYDTDGHMLRLQLRKCHRQDNSIVVHMMRARMLI